MEVISLTSIAIIIILFYVFRKPLKQFNTDAPEVVSNFMSTVVKGSAQLDTIVSTNCAENEVECRKRITAVANIIKDEKLMSVDEAYKFIMGK